MITIWLLVLLGTNAPASVMPGRYGSKDDCEKAWQEAGGLDSGDIGRAHICLRTPTETWTSSNGGVLPLGGMGVRGQ